MVDLLDCTVMPYAWGSRTAIAELTGSTSPSSTPEAELWMGAHPMAPSRVTRSGDAACSLEQVIAANAERELGSHVTSSFGPRLPFLLKVLAADQPLSLQAHPNAAQAKAGFADEDRRGIPRDHATRSYKDQSHKPELLCALVPVDALCGFRRIADTLLMFDELGVRELEPVLAGLRTSPDAQGLRAVFGSLMTMPSHEGSRIVRAVVTACESTRSPAFAREHAWARKLDALYPGDVGVVSALLLNLVHLEPGEALYLDAGNLHAYLSGVGVEIMASSDNVLRGGLTKKHVDVPELLRVLDFTDGPVAPLRAQAIDAHERVWKTPAREFQLSAIQVAPNEAVTRDARGPEILLCTEGAAAIVPGDDSREIVLDRGRSAFVPASTGRYTVRTAGPARASLYRAAVNLT
ncbi:MAG: Mannose-6-phosphate isomerase [Labilithrix sp.]|jgi:mannose-6-phosphate isomerase|nr:Mannose-6-phosphate isomerase [Labilithrix sp.]